MKPIFFDQETKEWRIDKTHYDGKTGYYYDKYGEVYAHDAVNRIPPKPEVTDEEKLDIILSLLDKIYTKLELEKPEGEGLDPNALSVKTFDRADYVHPKHLKFTSKIMGGTSSC